MGSSLTEIAQQLKDSNKKVQLIYAFNGTGKTRLSREFKLLLLSDIEDNAEEQLDVFNRNILYYNAFTEDLFYWDNGELKLKIQPNNFTDWVLANETKEKDVIDNFQRYTDDKLTPKFNTNFSEVTFSFQRGNDEREDNIKISKGEESSFVWSIFYSLFDQIIDIRNTLDPIERENNKFDMLEYIFIDDPVTSLDDNHLIELAVDLAALVKSSKSDIKFIITTHNPLYYNVLVNELDRKDDYYGYPSNSLKKYCLEKLEDGTFLLQKQKSDSPFS